MHNKNKCDNCVLSSSDFINNEDDAYYLLDIIYNNIEVNEEYLLDKYLEAFSYLRKIRFFITESYQLFSYELLICILLNNIPENMKSEIREVEQLPKTTLDECKFSLNEIFKFYLNNKIKMNNTLNGAKEYIAVLFREYVENKYKTNNRQKVYKN